MPSPMRFLAAALLSLLAVLSSGAHAALMCSGTTCSDSTAFGLGGTSQGGSSGQSLSLAQFDPALGTLDAATLRISGPMFTGLSVMGYNPSDGGEDLQLIGFSSSFVPGQPYYFFHVLDLGFPTQIHRILLPSLVRACDQPVGADDGCTASVSDQEARNDVVGITDTTVLTGTGTFSVFAGAFGLAAFCEWQVVSGGLPPANPNRTCEAAYGSSFSGTLSVAYQFTPTALAVSAPGAFATFVVALTSLAGLALRRRAARP